MKIILAITFQVLFMFGAFAQSKTIRNLQDAARQEAYAIKMFDAYSDRAMQEGYDDISRLFCALSESEQIQMDNHNLQLERLDAAEIDNVVANPIEVRTTTENLEKSIDFVSDLKKKRFKKFETDAKKENLNDISDQFDMNKSIVEDHENLLKKEYLNMGIKIPNTYYVSTATGQVHAECMCVGSCKCELPPKSGAIGEDFAKF